ncbi:MAG: CopD family protein [Gemmatimonadaceae bacterium]
MQVEPLITWQEPLTEYVGMLAQFLGLGAVGFRFAAVRGRLQTSPSADERRVYDDALQRAAVLGLCGVVVQAGMFATSLPQLAARQHTTVPALLTGSLPTGAEALLFILALLGLALAAARQRGGWYLALVGTIFATLTAVLAGKWSSLVNPLHRVVGGLWLGTLFVLVVAGLSIVLRDEKTRERRGAIAADLVNGFSPMALTCGVIVVASGLTTAWKHLTPLSSLWTTPYGYALLVKLCIVAVVFGLGAWNWQRVRPILGSEDAAHRVRRSAKAELTAAALVLVASAILVSLPSPRPPRPPAGAAAAGSTP